MSEQVGTKNLGSTSPFGKLFRGTLGPEDIVSAEFPGGSAVTFPMGSALRDSATAGQKAKYTNAISVNDEAVGTGNGTSATFDLGFANVIAKSLKGYSAGNQKNASISAGTGTGGVDQIVFAVAPANAEAIKADYDYYSNAVGAVGACILLEAVATTVAGGNVISDAARDGSVDKILVVDSASALVDQYFKDALSKVSFD